MSKFETALAIINMVAIIIIPIAAVFTGQLLQDRRQKRSDKLDIFKTLMANRYGWSVESVRAMNIIGIVFSDDDTTMGVLTAEIGQEHKLNRFELASPYRVGEWEAVVAWATPGPADG